MQFAQDGGLNPPRVINLNFKFHKALPMMLLSSLKRLFSRQIQLYQDTFNLIL